MGKIIAKVCGILSTVCAAAGLFFGGWAYGERRRTKYVSPVR